MYHKILKNNKTLYVLFEDEYPNKTRYFKREQWVSDALSVT